MQKTYSYSFLESPHPPQLRLLVSPRRKSWCVGGADERRWWMWAAWPYVVLLQYHPSRSSRWELLKNDRSFSFFGFLKKTCILDFNFKTTVSAFPNQDRRPTALLCPRDIKTFDIIIMVLVLVPVLHIFGFYPYISAPNVAWRRSFGQNKSDQNPPKDIAIYIRSSIVCQGHVASTGTM